MSHEYKDNDVERGPGRMTAWKHMLEDFKPSQRTLF
jgi:hypothetical protein